MHVLYGATWATWDTWPQYGSLISEMEYLLPIIFCSASQFKILPQDLTWSGHIEKVNANTKTGLFLSGGKAAGTLYRVSQRTVYGFCGLIGPGGFACATRGEVCNA